jgi:hypothetical protein
VLLVIFAVSPVLAATGGSISGAVVDQTGAVVPGATIRLINVGQQTTFKAISDQEGLYAFPNLPVGRYELTISAAGFTTQRKRGLAVDTDSSTRVDIRLTIETVTDTVSLQAILAFRLTPYRLTSAKSCLVRKWQHYR